MIAIDLPWPPRVLHPNARVRVWTEADDAYLRAQHGVSSLREIAAGLGRSTPSVRARITRIGIAKKVLWTDAEEAALIELYTQAGHDGVLGLAAFAQSMGRDPKNISRKAKELGLPTNLRRRVVENRKVKVNKYANLADAHAAVGAATKERFKREGHPRGMAGKRHSQEALEKISKASTAWAASLSEDERSAWTLKRMKSKLANFGTLAPTVKRGSWMAGWREIGGKRNFYRSRWEANYARYLQWLKERGVIADWEHEPETFWFDAIKRGVRSYKPDFRVWENDQSSCLHEVKGWMDSRSKTTLKRMAKYHPSEKIILIDGRQYRAIRIKVMTLIEGWEDAARDAHV